MTVNRDIVIAVVLALALIFSGGTAGMGVQADTSSPHSDDRSVCSVSADRPLNSTQKRCLQRTYAPVFHFHEDEQYRPTSVKKFVKFASIDGENVTASDLPGRDDDLELDSAQYTHQRYPDLPNIVYVSFGRADYNFEEYMAVTYWTFYFHDSKAALRDKFGADAIESGDPASHQSDFESVTILVNSSGAQWVGASQHLGGERRPWHAVKKRNGTHPHLYVAEGAHSLYFVNTERFDSEIYGQNHHMGNSGHPTNVPLFGLETFSNSPRRVAMAGGAWAYSDVTGNASMWTRTGTEPTYELRRLTGDEPWQQFEGSFIDSLAKKTLIGDAEPPAKRNRWKNPGQWMESLLSYEEQIDIGASWPLFGFDKGSFNGTTLVVEPRIANKAPQPATLHARITVRDQEGDVLYREVKTVNRSAGGRSVSKQVVRIEKADVDKVSVKVSIYAGRPNQTAINPETVLNGTYCTGHFGCAF